MQNPFDPNYLTTASAAFGPFAWIFFGLQLAATLWGLYILYVRADNNGVRRALWRQLGVALVVAGGIGLLLSVLRLANVPVLNQRYWFYIQLLVELALAGYVFYFARTSYPRLLAESQARGRTSTVRRGAAAPARAAAPRQQAVPRSSPAQPSSEDSAVPTIGRPAAASGRRESRRERKRRSR
jgi:hypothetical protein